MRFRLVATCLLLAFFASSCLSQFSPVSKQHLTDAKAFHIKVIEGYTTGSDKRYSFAQVEELRDSGDLHFREAIEFAKTLNDATRLKNFQVLHKIFYDDMGLLLENGKFSRPFSEELIQTANRAYEEAIKGEDVRYGGEGENADR